MTQPVVPGQPILPSLTAQWFNETLKKPKKHVPPRREGVKHHNEHRASLLETSDDVETYEPVAVSSPIDTALSPEKRVERAMFVTTEGLNEYNWIVAQGPMTQEAKTQLCVYSGITYAKVTILNEEHTHVTYDTVTNRLVSSFFGKGIILYKGEQYSFISIETFQEDGDSGSGLPIKFQALENINERTVNCIVLHSRSATAPRYSVVEVFDPNNNFSTIIKGCVGFAAYTRGVWEIITCSLPATEIKVTIEDELTANNSGVGVLNLNTLGSLRSTYPNVVPPAPCESSCLYTWNISTQTWQLTTPCSGDCTCTQLPTTPPEDPQLEGQTLQGVCVSNEDEIIIEFANPFKLDAVCNSDVILQRVSNADFASFNQEAPEVGSATSFEWQVIQVEKKHARWITLTYSDTSVTSFCDGEDPSLCDEITVEYPHGTPCEGDLVTAYYCPESNSYKAIATNSAMLGPPTPVNVSVGNSASSCGVNVLTRPFKMFPATCDSLANPPTTTPIALGTTVPVVVAVNAGDCGKIDYAWQNIKVFACDNAGEPTSPSFSDFTLNLGGARFLTGGYFGGPSCSNNSEWTWDGTNWQLTDPCESGCSSSTPSSPGTTIGQTTTTACNANAGTGCGLNLITKTLEEICSTNPSPPPGETTHIPLNLQEVNVVQEVYLGTNEIVIDRAKIYVCDWEVAAGDSIPLNECPVEPPPCSENMTVYTWNVDNQEWQLTTACPEGCSDGSPPQDPPEDIYTETTVSVPCTNLGGG